MVKSFSHDELIHKFSEALGNEKAAALIDETLGQAKLEKKTGYEKDEVLELVKCLKLKGGFIAILASCLASEVYRQSAKR